jgi:hypothetical protein
MVGLVTALPSVAGTHRAYWQFMNGNASNDVPNPRVFTSDIARFELFL